MCLGYYAFLVPFIMLPLHFVCNNVFCKSSLYNVKTKHPNVDCIEYIAPLGIFTLYLLNGKRKRRQMKDSLMGSQSLSQIIH